MCASMCVSVHVCLAGCVCCLMVGVQHLPVCVCVCVHATVEVPPLELEEHVCNNNKKSIHLIYVPRVVALLRLNVVLARNRTLTLAPWMGKKRQKIVKLTVRLHGQNPACETNTFIVRPL